MVFSLLILAFVVSGSRFPKMPHPIEKMDQQTFTLSKHYRWSVLPGDMSPRDACNQQVCRNGERHTVCPPYFTPAATCKDFKLLDMDFSTTRKFVMGHNGLRNRVAKMSGWFARNMNYIVRFFWRFFFGDLIQYDFQHWDDSLALMAENFVHKCQFGNDSCDFICKYSFHLFLSVFLTLTIFLLLFYSFVSLSIYLSIHLF